MGTEVISTQETVSELVYARDWRERNGVLVKSTCCAHRTSWLGLQHICNPRTVGGRARRIHEHCWLPDQPKKGQVLVKEETLSQRNEGEERTPVVSLAFMYT